jgi:hypothetical protein
MTDSKAQRVPDFLIVGAMKSGSTTLYRDLSRSARIFLPEEKEPDTLVSHNDDVEAMVSDYKSLFAPAPDGALLGEASTSYTKRPDYENAAQNALNVCGPNLKILYVTRDPIKRIISQYEHEFGLGLVEEPLNEALLKHDRYVAYSSYDWQIAPWREAFGDANVMQIEMEAYVKNREQYARAALEFLTIDPGPDFNLELDRTFNSRENKPVATGGLAKAIVESKFYQRSIKTAIPKDLRESLASLVLPKAKVSNETMQADVEDTLKERLQNWGK